MQTLYGREHELHKLNGMIDHVNERGGALTVQGEAGIGKSSLLVSAHARARAHGMLVLSATGVQSEARLPFAGLHQLLHSVIADVTELPDPQRSALLAAFGMTATSPPDLFLIALAVLNLLAGVASHAPLLVIVEDAQWLDQSTCDVLMFVARRLEADPIILLISLRDGFESVLADGSLPEMHLGRLAPDAAVALLDEQAPNLSPAVRARLLADAEGNPLALVELPLALSAEQLGGGAPLPEVLPLTARLERAFGARVAQLPEATRTLLLIAALNDGGSLAEVLQAAVLLDATVATEEALEPAVRADLVVIDDHTLVFRHPLVRSAIRQAATIARLRAVHSALASVLANRPDRSIWHRAASQFGPDDEVATALEAAATRAQHRGAHAVAVAAVERAAHFTAQPALRGERLVRAANMAFELGRRDLGMHLLQQAEPLDLPPLERTLLAWLMEGYGTERVWSGATRIASFVELADQASDDGNLGSALRLLVEIALRCYWSNLDQQTRERVVSTAERLPVPDDDPRLLAVLALAAPVESGASVIARLARLPSPSASDGPEMAHLLSTAASAVGDFVSAAQLAAIGIDGLRSQGRLGALAQLLLTQAFSTFYLGTWNVTMPAAAEAGRLACETGQSRWAATVQPIEAMLAALRGEYAIAEALISEAEQALLPVGATPLLALVQQARGLLALTERRYAAAFEHIHRVFVSTDVAYHPVVRCWALADLVEAAVHSGHRDEAQAIVADMELLVAATRFPYLQVSLSYVRPLLADDDSAEVLFQAAFDTDDMTRRPFLHARLQLAYGSWLRRQRRVAESRAPLRAAREAFDALRAVPWGERARQELRASGETSRRRVPEVRDQLSPQELQIAQMVAEGLSNREIGQRLFLSHRTVGSHLYRIFPKLGITARAELRAAIGSQVLVT